jgi:putative tricarboxylic transport membrane protein
MRTLADDDEISARDDGNGSAGGPGSERRPVADRLIRRHQFAGAVAVSALGVATVIGALDLGYWQQGPGPGFFPLWAGVLLVLLAVIWAGQVARGVALPAEAPVAEGGVRQVMLVVVALAALVASLDLVGYQLSMSVFVFYTLVVVGRRRWLESLVVAALAGFGVYTLFASVLQVFLPTASLGVLAGLGF